jgi:tetratricopeptide (TPR) repeat protein
MSHATSVDDVREQAQKALSALRGMCRDEDVQAARGLVEALRNQRDYVLMGRLAEVISRRDAGDAKNRRLYGQYLIETGHVTAAIDVLKALAQRLPPDDPESVEAGGLLGRAYKQIYFDAADKEGAAARDALARAIEAYRRPYERDPRRTWHGVNLVALLGRAGALPDAAGLDAEAIARQVVATLDAMPADRRDEWYGPTLAEASLGLRDWDVIEANVKQYVTAPDAKAFQLASTLRQFTEVWDLERRDERGRALVDMLRARLMQLPEGQLTLPPGELQRLRLQPAPDTGQLEAVLGANGAQTYRWWRTGIQRATGVAAIRARIGTRVGTGFLIRAGDLGRTPEDELLVLTNFHVVNELGASSGLHPAEVEIVFEAADPAKVYAVKEILWSSSTDRHDASVLRLADPVSGIDPLPLARGLPVVDDAARVYIIGHPGGRDLSFSFQDNELLDHEGPPHGKPGIEGVCRLHYRAPTEGGSSGSPVFNANQWEVIALHHKGGKIGMPRLNGKDGSYGANEGISIHSIAAASRQ